MRGASNNNYCPTNISDEDGAGARVENQRRLWSAAIDLGDNDGRRQL